MVSGLFPDRHSRVQPIGNGKLARVRRVAPGGGHRLGAGSGGALTSVVNSSVVDLSPTTMNWAG